MKKYPKNCIDCDQGKYQVLRVDYEQVCQDGNLVIVPDVEILRCSHCNQELIPAASSKQLSAAVAEANEQLKPAQLYAMFERFDVDQQKELAEICGFGEKTFGRWLKGTQVTSRSMGYYLRVLDRFPEAFEYIKERKWRTEGESRSASEPTQTESTEDDNLLRFPALSGRSIQTTTSSRNFASIFACAEG